jgi:hypothetical protein
MRSYAFTCQVASSTFTPPKPTSTSKPEGVRA